MSIFQCWIVDTVPYYFVELNTKVSLFFKQQCPAAARTESLFSLVGPTYVLRERSAQFAVPKEGNFRGRRGIYPPSLWRNETEETNVT